MADVRKSLEILVGMDITGAIRNAEILQKKIALFGRNINSFFKGADSGLHASTARQQKAISKLTGAQGYDKFQRIGKTAISPLNSELAALGNVSDRIKIPMKQLTTVGLGWNNVMGMSMETLKQVHDEGLQKNFTGMGRLAYRTRNLTHGMRGFRMELLGVMFFGMGIQRFFQGMLNPALKLAGVFELLSTVLGVMFLPTGLKVQQWVINLLGWWNELNPATQGVIRTFVELGFVLGGLLFLYAMSGLGIGSIILASQKWSLAISSIATAFQTIPWLATLGYIALIVGAIIGLLALWKNWESVSWKVKLALFAVAAIVAVVAAVLGAPFIAAVAGVTAAIIGLMALTKNWEVITAKFSDLWQKVFNALPEPVQNALNAIKGPLTEIINFLLQVIDVWQTAMTLGIPKLISTFSGGGETTPFSNRGVSNYVTSSGESNYGDLLGNTINVNVNIESDVPMTMREVI